MNDLDRNLQAWVAEVLTQEHSARVPYGGGNRLLLGTLVFGKYVQRFLKYCVGSLRWEGNLSALSVRPQFFVHTDQKSMPALMKGLEPLLGLAEVFLLPIAEDFDHISKQGPNYRYVFLGASEIVNAKRALFRGLHFHCLFPDVVYPVGYFRRLEFLLASGHKAVLSHSLNAVLEDIRPHLRHPLDAKKLATLALKYLHPRQMPYVMNAREKGVLPPVPHLLFAEWDRVTVCGMHANLALLHNDLLGFGDVHLNATLDAQLPYYLQMGTSLYMPQRDDEMTIVELSDREFKGYFRRPGSDLHEFALRFWALAKGEPGYEDIINLATEFPLETLPPWRPMPQAVVDAQLGKIRDYVHQIHPEVLRAFEMGGIIEVSGINGPLQLPQDRLKEAVLAARTPTRSVLRGEECPLRTDGERHLPVEPTAVGDGTRSL